VNINDIDDIDELEKAIDLDIAFENNLSEFYENKDFHEFLIDLENCMPVEMNDFQKALFDFNQHANILCDITAAQIYSLIDFLYVYALLIVEEFNNSLNHDKTKNPHFRYWKHFCIVTKGKTAVVIRWKRYRGKGVHSDPVNKGMLKAFKMPSGAFIKCSNTEKKAIMIAEDKFSKIRRINSKMGTLIESARSMKYITDYQSKITKDHETLEEDEKIEDLEKYHADREKTHGQFDRHEFRRSLGL